MSIYYTSYIKGKNGKEVKTVHKKSDKQTQVNTYIVFK